MAVNSMEDLVDQSLHADRTVGEWMIAEDVAERTEIEIDMAGRVDLGLYAVGEIIRDLEPYVTGGATLPDTAKALQLVVNLLNMVQILERADVHLLVEYFCQRLKNPDDNLNFRAGVKESAEALLALANMTERKRFPPGDTELVVKAVFAVDTSGTLRSLKASTRLALFNLLDFLMEAYKANIIKSTGAKQFVQGLVSMGELEKDPYCLVVLFRLYEELSRDWELDEETYLLIWESYSRYFPINIGGAAKDPTAPKPDEIRALLLSCFISNDSYAKEAFPRLIEMLDTNQDLTANVKKDVFNTMTACVTGYSLETSLEWTSKIWDSVKFEIWNGENEDFIKGALQVINAMSQAIGEGAGASDDECNDDGARFLLGVLKECVERIVDSKQRYMLSTGRILYAIADASPFTFAQVTAKILPALLILWDDLINNSEKSSLLAVFNLILRARFELGKRLTEDVAAGITGNSVRAQRGQIKAHEALLVFKERLVEQVYWKAMMENVSDSPDDTLLRVATIQGLVLLTAIPQFLLDFEHGTIISTLNKIVLDPTQSEKMHDEAVEALQQVSMHDPERFSSVTLANFVGQLPNIISEDISEVIKILDGLTTIACSETCIPQGVASSVDFPTHAVFNAFQNSMLTKLFEILDNKQQLSYANIILAAMLRGLQLFDATLDKEATAAGIIISPRTPENHPYAWIVLQILQKLAVVRPNENIEPNSIKHTPYIGLSIELDSAPEKNEKFVALVGEIATLALRSNQTNPINNFLTFEEALNSSQVCLLFLNAIPQGIELEYLDLRRHTVDEYLALVISMHLVAGVRREDLKLTNINVGNVAHGLLYSCIAFEDAGPFARVALLQLLQLFINKFGAASALTTTVVERTLSDLMEEFVNYPPNDTTVCLERNYQTLSYFTAAALARCDKSDKHLIDLMIEGISHPSVGRKVAQSFRTLLAPSQILTKENFCIIRPLRQGRLYAYTVDTLINLWRTSPDAKIKSNALIAVVGILSYLDTSVYSDNAATLLPIMLEGTHIQDNWTKLACITVIRKLIPSHPSVIVSHLDSIIARMTDRTRNTYYSPSDANAEARSAAIDVLGLLTKHVEPEELLKRRSAVVKELDIAVDDCSSVVRARAAACKLKWFNLGE